MKLKTLLLIGILIITVMAIPASAAPIEIASADDLAKIGGVYALDGDYVLTKDITLSGAWTPIGIDENKPFKGKFDGQSHTISNLKVSNTNEVGYAGLFGYTDGAEIKNLNLKKIDLTGIRAGSLAGIAKNTLVYNCHASDGKITVSRAGGGLIGIIREGSDISFSSAEDMTLSGDGAQYLGGFIGRIRDGCNVKSCWADTDITGTSTGDAGSNSEDTMLYGVGGFTGGISSSTSLDAGDKSLVSDCYALGDISVKIVQENLKNPETYNTGGFIGYAAPSEITRCYSAGDVEVYVEKNSKSNTKYITGGFIGSTIYGPEINNCLAAGDEVSLSAKSAGSVDLKTGAFLGYEYDNKAVLTNNYVLDSMEINGKVQRESNSESLDKLKTQEFYSSTLKWNIGKESDKKTWFIPSKNFPWLTMPSESSPSSEPLPQSTSSPLPILGILAGVGAVIYAVRRQQ